MPTAAAMSDAQVRLSDKGRAIKRLVVCYLVWLGRVWIYGLAQGAWVSGRDGYRAQVAQHPLDTYIHTSNIK